MAKVFETNIIKQEFKELYQTIIPSLNKCGNCNILKCRYCFLFRYDCTDCRISRCKNCQLFKNSKDILFKNCSIQQWNYIVNFLHDLFNTSDYSFLWYSDLKPISELVKKKNKIFLYLKEVNDYLVNNNNNNNNNNNKKIQCFLKNRKFYWRK